MSTKKYVMKKDLKPMIINFKAKGPSSILNTPASKPRMSSNQNCPSSIFPCIKKPNRVAKSLQTLASVKRKRVKSLGRKKLEMSLPNALYQVSLHNNLRYLKSQPEDFDDKNVIETPSDSLKIPQDSLEIQIKAKYQAYIDLPPNIPMIEKRSLTPDSLSYLNIIRKRNELSDSPQEIRFFWKSKRIF